MNLMNTSNFVRNQCKVILSNVLFFCAINLSCISFACIQLIQFPFYNMSFQFNDNPIGLVIWLSIKRYITRLLFLKLALICFAQGCLFLISRYVFQQNQKMARASVRSTEFSNITLNVASTTFQFCQRNNQDYLEATYMDKLTGNVWTKKYAAFFRRKKNPSKHSRKISVVQFEKHRHRQTKKTQCVCVLCFFCVYALTFFNVLKAFVFFSANTAYFLVQTVQVNFSI